MRRLIPHRVEGSEVLSEDPETVLARDRAESTETGEGGRWSRCPAAAGEEKEGPRTIAWGCAPIQWSRRAGEYNERRGGRMPETARQNVVVCDNGTGVRDVCVGSA